MARTLKPYEPTPEDRAWVQQMVRILKHLARMGTQHAVYVLDKEKQVFKLETPSDPWATPLTALGHHRLEAVAATIGWTVEPKVDWAAIELPDRETDLTEADIETMLRVAKDKNAKSGRYTRATPQPNDTWSQTLVCGVLDAADDSPDHFMFDMTRDFAEFLLKMHSCVIGSIAVLGETVHCVEVLRNVGQWGRITGYETNWITNFWEVAGPDTSILAAEVELCSIIATTTGVAFQAMRKNGTTYFQSSEIPWEKITAYAEHADTVPPKLFPAAEIDYDENKGDDNADDRPSNDDPERGPEAA